MIYLYTKAVHIIFVVCWMAALFYMPRLFIYHQEAKDKSQLEFDILHKQFTLMERRLWWVIATPAMYLVIASALTLLYLNPGLLKMGWMHFKLLFVAGLIFYHFKSQQMMFQLARKQLKWSSSQLRLWNEVATIILFAIVFLVVLKSTINWIFGLVGLLSLAIVLMLLIKLYKRYRMKNSKKVE